MKYYQSLIDPTNFGIVADYLRSPKSPIEHVLHVKDRLMLARLAEHLDQAMQDPDAARTVSVLIDGFIKEGLLLISSRHPLELSDPSRLVTASNVPRSSACDVIYLPPFYLVHTPGLFEGTLVRNTTATNRQITAQHLRGMRIKL